MHDGKETIYPNLWRKVASFFKEERGALGSILHKSEDGAWVVYSKWPNVETWQKSWPMEGEAADLPDDILDAVRELKACLNHDLPFEKNVLTVVDGLL